MAECPPFYTYIAADFAIGEKQMNDRTVLLPFGVCPEANLYLGPDPVVDRMNAHVIVDKLMKLIHAYKPMGLILEHGHIQASLQPTIIERMRKEHCETVIHSPAPTRDKVARFAGFQAMLQQGRVFFPQTPLYKTELIPELLSFPTGKHDDFADACAYTAYVINELALPLPPKENEAICAKDVEGSYEWHMARIEAAEEALGEDGRGSAGPGAWNRSRKSESKLTNRVRVNMHKNRPGQKR